MMNESQRQDCFLYVITFGIKMIVNDKKKNAYQDTDNKNTD